MSFNICILRFHLKWKSEIRSNSISLVQFSIFAVLLIIFVVMKYFAYNYPISDLGLTYRLEYEFIYQHTFFYTEGNYLIAANGITKLIFVPLSLSLLIWNSPSMVAIQQVVLVGLGGVVIYQISFTLSQNKAISNVFQLIYYLYPSTYGFLPNGGNFMVYFQFFFLLSFLFYLKGKYRMALLSTILAATTNLLAPFLIVLFYLLEFAFPIKHVIDKRIIRDNNPSISKSKNQMFVISTFALMAIFETIISYPFGGPINLIIHSMHYGAAVGAGNPTLIPGTPLSLPGIVKSVFMGIPGVKLQFLEGLLGPLLFLSVVSPYAILVVIFFIGAWYSNYSPFYNTTTHYNFLITPFLFLGAIRFATKNKTINTTKKIVSLMLIATFISFILISPFNYNNFENGTIYNEIHATTFEKEMNQALSKIPVNASVFVQGELPQIMNRALVVTPQLYKGQHIDYAIFIPFGFSLNSKVFNDYSQKWANFFATNSSYGIYESIQGATIYKYNYKAFPVTYIPMNISQNLNLNYTLEPKINGTIFKSPSYNLAPGNFRVAMSFEYNNSDQVNATYSIINIVNSNSTYINVSPRLVDIHHNEYLLEYSFNNNIFSSFQFVLKVKSNMAGTFILTGLNLSQTTSV